jgi:predicted glycosyltransferase involved in capsule biosynthesis
MSSDKYKRFSKVFVKLSDESQNKLIKIAHSLHRAHQYSKHETDKQKSCHKRNICVEN